MPSVREERPSLPESTFCRRLRPLGRILEDPDHHVWCCSPIWGDDGRVHVFYSRFPNRIPHTPGWLTHSEIAHAVADRPEGPYRVVGVALRGRGAGHWDALTMHNPTIHRVGDRYALFYIASAGTPETPWSDLVASQRIGLSVADSLDGPWPHRPAPLLETGPAGAWDDLLTTNPAFLAHPSGKYWLYYKSMKRRDWETLPNGRRKYGVAVADQLEGPYIKHAGNPVVDVSGRHAAAQLEDAYVWLENGRYRMLARDMGTASPAVGLYFESADGITWSAPEIGYHAAPRYLAEAWNMEPELARFERPQILFTDGRPTHLFAACRGGRSGTSSAVVLAIGPE